MLLGAIEVRSPGIAREGFDALPERQDVSILLPNAVRACQTNMPGFLNREVFKQLTNSFERAP